MRWGTEEQKQRLQEAGCSVVPVLYQGPLSEEVISEALHTLEINGSVVAPGFMQPEGVVIYNPGIRSLFKKTFGSDEHKGS